MVKLHLNKFWACISKPAMYKRCLDMKILYNIWLKAKNYNNVNYNNKTLSILNLRRLRLKKRGMLSDF